MTRRDIIIIAVLANIGVLSILFMLAFRTEETLSDPSELTYTMVEERTVDNELSLADLDLAKEPSDEMDRVLEEVTPLQMAAQFFDDESKDSLNTAGTLALSAHSLPDETYPLVEVTVKKGDALDKIARANGTTSEAIIKANHLRNDKLKIGQVLKVPINTVKPVAPAPTTPNERNNPSSSLQDKQYHTMNSGDNLWKIAKQFHTQVDDLLRLNELDEESARKLKSGDRIRVR